MLRWLITRLAGWFAVGFSRRPPAWLVGCFIRWCVGKLLRYLITLLAGWFLTEFGRWYSAGLAGVPRIGLTSRLMAWLPAWLLAGLAGWLLARLVGWAV